MAASDKPVATESDPFRQHDAAWFIQGAVRFALELVAWGAAAYWGWQQSDSRPVQVLLAIGLPLLMMAAWGVFRTPGDESAGPGKVATPGPVRLLIEVVTFGFAAFALWTTVSRAAAETFLTVAIMMYVLSWQRIRWLVNN